MLKVSHWIDCVYDNYTHKLFFIFCDAERDWRHRNHFKHQKSENSNTVNPRDDEEEQDFTVTQRASSLKLPASEIWACVPTMVTFIFRIQGNTESSLALWSSNVLFPSFDIFSFVLQSWKQHERAGVSKHLVQQVLRNTALQPHTLSVHSQLSASGRGTHQQWCISLESPTCRSCRRRSSRCQSSGWRHWLDTAEPETSALLSDTEKTN